MGLALVFVAAAAALAYPAARVILTHGVPVIQTNDPALADAAPHGSSSARSWLALIALITGLLVGTFGAKEAVVLIDTQWMVVLIAAVAVVAAAAVDVAATVSFTRTRPNEVIDILAGPRQLPAHVWLARFGGAFLSATALGIFNQVFGFGWSFLLVLIVWLMPSMGARYAHNRGAEQE